MFLPCLIGLEGPELTSEEESSIRKFQPAGFVLFSRNIVTAEQTRQLTDRLRAVCGHTPVIAIDQEGGRVVRTSALGIELPSARTMRTRKAMKDIPEMARLIATSLKFLGINTDFAPVLDVCHDETVANALPGRCWGTTPQQVISCAGVFNQGLTGQGIAGCGKHFPGMGMAASDPHQDLPVLHTTLDVMLRSDLLPFLALGTGLPSIMVAHLLLPSIDGEWPSTLSHRVITGILRNQIGYKGLIMTDDLCMGAINKRFGVAEAAVMSLKAGCDLPLVCHNSLEYLKRIVELLPEWPSCEVKDRTKRLARFLKPLSPPLPLSREKWDLLVEETHQFTVNHADDIRHAPHSPVEEY